MVPGRRRQAGHRRADHPDHRHRRRGRLRRAGAGLAGHGRAAAPARLPRFVKQYADLRTVLGDAARAFAEDVAAADYPGRGAHLPLTAARVAAAAGPRQRQHGPPWTAERVHALRDAAGIQRMGRAHPGLRRRAARVEQQPGGLLLVGTPTRSRGTWRHTSTTSHGSPALPGLVADPGAVGATAAGTAASVGDAGAARGSEPGETVFVVAPDAAPETLLERVADARRIGATMLSIDDGDDELGSFAHDRLVVPTTRRCTRRRAVDARRRSTSTLVPHLVSVAAGENVSRYRNARSHSHECSNA